MAFENPSQEVIFGYLRQAKNIAIVGLSNRPSRTSYLIAEALQKDGYRIFPVNPLLLGETILGEKVYANLKDIPEEIDIVNIFRRSEFLAEVAADFVETNAKVFWAQLDVESDTAANFLRAHGKNDIVMNRCIKIELAYSGIKRPNIKH
ncbi:MAG: CoA-binding protein [Streptococcaceae bacterium]|jgi:predicted CoA-binding protein|nr:CoA-binding protein [Streptococcaceae bacterium]